MTLLPTELDELLAEDGLLDADGLARLRAAGLDPGAWAGVRAQLHAALLDGAGDPPELADAVAAALGHPGLGIDVSAALLDGAGDPPELADAVAAALGHPGLGIDVGAALLDGAGDPPELAGAVAAALGHPGLGIDLRAALVAEAGEPPAGPAGQVHLLPVGAPAPARPPGRAWWMLPAAAMAASTLLMLASRLLSPAGPAPALPEPVAANAIQIEEIATEVDAVVHVLQSGDADDTPIIFVDVLDEASPSLDAPGRTL
jgi:hypothetical protein